MASCYIYHLAINASSLLGGHVQRSRNARALKADVVTKLSDRGEYEGVVFAARNAQGLKRLGIKTFGVGRRQKRLGVFRTTIPCEQDVASAMLYTQAAPAAARTGVPFCVRNSEYGSDADAPVLFTMPASALP